MFIKKIIKSKKVGCILKLNITASTLYCTQAMENEPKAYFNIVKSENSENIYKEQNNFISRKKIRGKNSDYEVIEELNDINFDYKEIEELKELKELKDISFDYKEIEELNNINFDNEEIK